MSQEAKFKLVGVMMHNGVNLFIPRIGVVTGLDLTKHGHIIERLEEEESGKVNIYWRDEEKILQKSAVSQANIVSYRYIPEASVKK